MNNNMLVSTAMLNAYWEKEKKDTLDLLVPFVKYSIAKTSKVNEKIDICKTTEYFKQKFGYETIPANVIIQILKRLTPSILEKANSIYTLKVSLDKEVEAFDKKNLYFKEHSLEVGRTLAEFLNNNLIKANYNQDSALQVLIIFFATNGLCIINDTELLELIKRKDDTVRYAIAQFIIREHSGETIIFKYIEEMVKGFFVSSAIAFHAQNSSPVNAKFNDLNCYIDTRIIIDALGLHLPEAQKTSQELLKMLKDKGAQLFCFEHTFDEIDDIVNAYKNGLKYPLNTYNHPTLEGWDDKKFNVTDVENYQRLLRNKIEGLNIKIVPTPEITNICLYPFNHKDISDYIKTFIKYKNDDALEYDISSIASIFVLRNGHKTLEIEKSKAVFVTSNITLTKTVSAFLNVNNICDFSTETPPIITDLDLSSIVWLKCFSTHKDFPRHRLIEFSMAALEPTSTIMSTFYDFVEKIKSEGGITDDEAAIIRTDGFCRKILSTTIKGNIEKLTKDTVLEIKERLRREYVGNADNETRLNYERYLEEKEKLRDKYKNAIERIKQIHKKAFKTSRLVFNVLTILIITTLFVLSIVTAIFAFDSAQNIVISIFSFLTGVFGTLDLLLSKCSFIKKITNKFSQRIACYFSDKKKEEYETILGEIPEFDND